MQSTRQEIAEKSNSDIATQYLTASEYQTSASPTAGTNNRPAARIDATLPTLTLTGCQDLGRQSELLASRKKIEVPSVLYDGVNFAIVGGKEVLETLGRNRYIARPNEYVVATSGANITALAGSHVQARHGANVIAECGAVVDAAPGSIVEAHDGSTILQTNAAGSDNNRSTARDKAVPHLEIVRAVRPTESFRSIGIMSDWFIPVSGHSWALFRPNDNAGTDNQSAITAEDEVAVVAQPLSTVTAHNRAKVIALRGSTVDAFNSEVRAYDGSIVRAFGTGTAVGAHRGSRVEAGYGSLVVAGAGSGVTAGENSNVGALNGSAVIADFKSHVRGESGSYIYGGGYSIIADKGANRVDGSTIRIYNPAFESSWSALRLYLNGTKQMTANQWFDSVLSPKN